MQNIKEICKFIYEIKDNMQKFKNGEYSCVSFNFNTKYFNICKLNDEEGIKNIELQKDEYTNKEHLEIDFEDTYMSVYIENIDEIEHKISEGVNPHVFIFRLKDNSELRITYGK